MAKTKEELVKALQEMELPKEGSKEWIKYNEESRNDALNFLLKDGFTPEQLATEVIEQGWDDVSPVVKIIRESVDDNGDTIKTETTMIENTKSDDEPEKKEEDETKSFFKSFGKRLDENNHWKDYKPKKSDLSGNKHKYIIF